MTNHWIARRTLFKPNWKAEILKAAFMTVAVAVGSTVGILVAHAIVS